MAPHVMFTMHGRRKLRRLLRLLVWSMHPGHGSSFRPA